jgi:hypothetical protein
MNWFHSDHTDREILQHIAMDLDTLVKIFALRLTSIKIVFKTKENTTMGTPGTPQAPAAVSLAVGQMAIATVVGFDQTGAPFTGLIPNPTWSIDNPAFDKIAADPTNPQNEDVTSLAPGVATLTAGVAGPNGTTLTATGIVTNVPATTAPVLTSIGIQFSAPTTPAAVAAARAAQGAAVKK